MTKISDLSKEEQDKIKKLQEHLKSIKITPEQIQHAREISRECSKISVERLYRPFDL